MMSEIWSGANCGHLDEQGLDRLALDVLHRDEGNAAFLVLSDVVDRDDVRVGEDTGRLRFPHEALAKLPGLRIVLVAPDARIVLIATRRPIEGSLARYTTPIAPLPSSLRISNRPRRLNFGMLSARSLIVFFRKKALQSG